MVEYCFAAGAVVVDVLEYCLVADAVVVDDVVEYYFVAENCALTKRNSDLSRS